MRIPPLARATRLAAAAIPALAALLSAARPAAAQQHATDPLAAYMGHGVSHELATWRAGTVRDVRYDLALDVTSPDSAIGTVTVRFTRSGGDDAILDFRGRRLRAMTVNGTAATPDFNGNHIRIPARMLRAGQNAVALSFVSEIAPTGASIIRVHDPVDRSDYLYTLLVPADANQLFPCFDQPDLKARVTFALTFPIAWTALANGSVAHSDTTGDRVTNHFTETKPLPTYLIAFAAGPWSRFTSTVHGRTVHVYIRHSRAHEADPDSMLALQQRALDWMERYFARPYPFEKFDMLLAPAFPFGGMEHPGVVMYNEDSFIFRERPTLSRRLGRFSTILHETAHQWFGDLVTMRWFDDLWLKEGFATYMAAKALNDLEPNSEAWKTFYQSNKPSAYGVDQTMGTTPLWQAMGNLDQAKSAYGAIVYNKAPSVLKQLNYLVGEPAFQLGLRNFLAAHAYANATWQDLLGAVGSAWTTTSPADAKQAAGASGNPLDAFGRNFMLRPGMPIVETRVSVRDGRIASLELVQHPAQPALSGAAAWPMRTQVLLAYGAAPAVKIPVALTGLVTDVPAARGQPAPRFVFPNADDQGYFLSLLDTASVTALEHGALRDVHDGLLRAMLWGALWDQVRDTRLDPVRYANLVLAELPYEHDEQIVPVLLGRLGRDIDAYLSPARAASIRAGAERTLWQLANDTSRAYGVRRAALTSFTGLAASPEGVAHLKSLLTADSAAGEPVRDPTRWSVVDRLLVLGDPGASAALATQAARDTTPDGRRRAFIAGAARGDSATKAEYFRRWFADKSLNEDWASGSLGAFNAIEHEQLTLPYLRPALDSLPYIQANRRIFFLGSWLGAFMNGQTTPAAVAVVHQYLDDHPNLPTDLRQKVLQYADELERTVRIRARWR
ncbi:MAG TPA: M1 family aminopeptidase [Gemmatimonadaceae bacterium]|nr:M1 family aminopeptidase [Gemmatimonadaceae bacterium]